MTRIKSVTIDEVMVMAPTYKQWVMEDGVGWDLATFRFHHFERDRKAVFHRVDK